MLHAPCPLPCAASGQQHFKPQCRVLGDVLFYHNSAPPALHPLLSALCSMPSAPCPLPCAASGQQHFKPQCRVLGDVLFYHNSAPPALHPRSLLSAPCPLLHALCSLPSAFFFICPPGSSSAQPWQTIPCWQPAESPLKRNCR